MVKVLDFTLNKLGKHGENIGELSEQKVARSDFYFERIPRFGIRSARAEAGRPPDSSLD